MEQNIPPIIAGALAAQEAINALGAGKPETPDEYAARHREQAAASKADRLEALAASLKEDSEHVTRHPPEELEIPPGWLRRPSSRDLEALS